MSLIQTYPQLHSYDYDSSSGYLNIIAIVEDAIMTLPATRYEPEEWGPGYCRSTVVWDEAEPPTWEAVEGILDDHHDWITLSPDECP